MIFDKIIYNLFERPTVILKSKVDILSRYYIYIFLACSRVSGSL